MNNLIRNIIIGAALLTVSAVFIVLNTDIFEDQSSVVVDTVIDKAPEAHVSEDRKKQETLRPKKNAAADGLSKFYASLNADMDASGPKIKNNVVFLPDPKGDLIKQLEAIKKVTRPLNKTWRGSKKSRPFRRGETLFQKLTEFANSDGLEVIWWLNRDFIVKDPFRINKSILKTSYQVGEAVEGHFHNGINTYFCFNQRAIVLTDKDIPYLIDECSLLSPSSR